MTKINIKTGFKPYPKYKDSGADWLGKVPATWEVNKIRRMFEVKKRISGRIDLDVLSITQKGVKIKDIESNAGQLSMDYSKYQIVEKGDFAMNHMDLLTGYVDISKYDGVVSPDYRVFSVRNKDMCARYFLYLFQMGYQQKIFYAYGRGAAQLGRWRFPANEFNNFFFPVPLYAEQEKIAKYLDEKTTLIDSIIEKKQKQIELLREKRSALVNHVVTKGLDPNVKLVDSGVQSVGKIPTGWQMRKISHLFTQIGSGTTPSENFLTEAESGVPWVNTGDLNDAYIEAPSKKVLKTALEEYSTLRLYPKTSIIIAMYGATIGKLGIPKFDFCSNQACCILAKIRTEISDRYVFYCLLGLKKGIIELGTGGGQPNINKEIVKSFKLPIPHGRQEQEKIVKYLDENVSKYDVMLEKIVTSMDLLKELKSSLISHAVTGKIKV